jgi:hypothetical protein
MAEDGRADLLETIQQAASLSGVGEEACTA